MVLNCHCWPLHTQQSETAEAKGRRSGYFRTILSRNKWRITLRRVERKSWNHFLTDRKTLLLEQRRGGQRHDRHGKWSQMCHGEAEKDNSSLQDALSRNWKRIMRKLTWVDEHRDFVQEVKDAELEKAQRTTKKQQQKQKQQRQQLLKPLWR